MGVYINMEMPESCDDCRMNNGISCYAVLEYTEDGVVGRTDDRPDWCPLVPVPSHGRLIDAKSLENMHFTESMYDAESKLFVPFVEVATAIFDAPTIIPAEEGEA